MTSQRIMALVAVVMSPGFAAAQDFTNMDITGMYNNWAAQQNSQMNQQTQQVIGQVLQDPRFRSMYQQYMASGGTASAEQYAYSYAATGGFTQQGMQNYQRSEAENAAKIQNAQRDLRNAEQGYRDAYGNYTDGYSENANEAGRTLMGNSTYVQPDSGSSYVLPHTWQADSYNMYNGQMYYVDQTGQYFAVDANNNMYPISQNQ